MWRLSNVAAPILGWAPKIESYTRCEPVKKKKKKKKKQQRKSPLELQQKIRKKIQSLSLLSFSSWHVMSLCPADTGESVLMLCFFFSRWLLLKCKSRMKLSVSGTKREYNTFVTFPHGKVTTGSHYHLRQRYVQKLVRQTSIWYRYCVREGDFKILISIRNFHRNVNISYLIHDIFQYAIIPF